MVVGQLDIGQVRMGLTTPSENNSDYINTEIYHGTFCHMYSYSDYNDYFEIII